MPNPGMHKDERWYKMSTSILDRILTQAVDEGKITSFARGSLMEAAEFMGDPENHNTPLKAAALRDITKAVPPEPSPMQDITAPDHVQIDMDDKGTTLWVNVDGLCVLRVSQIPPFSMDIRVPAGFKIMKVSSLTGDNTR
jgi:hypothetical protein